MKPVKDIDGGGGFFGNDGQIGFPHVTANKPQLLTSLRSEPNEESPERLSGAVGADPKQTPFSMIKLIHQSDKLIFAFPPADFVGADCSNSTEITMLEPPRDRHLHRAEDTVPTGFEYPRHFFPTQPFGPSSQEPGIGYSEVAFPFRPRQFFDLDSAGWAVYPSWSVEKENQDSPQWDELETPGTQSVVAGSPLATSGTDGLATGLRTQGNHQSWRSRVSPFAGLIDKTRLFFDTVQDSLYVHPVWPTLRSFLEETFPGKIRQDAFYKRPLTGQCFWVAWSPNSIKARPCGCARCAQP